MLVGGGGLGVWTKSLMQCPQKLMEVFLLVSRSFQSGLEQLSYTLWLSLLSNCFPWGPDCTFHIHTEGTTHMWICFPVVLFSPLTHMYNPISREIYFWSKIYGWGGDKIGKEIQHAAFTFLWTSLYTWFQGQRHLTIDFSGSGFRPTIGTFENSTIYISEKALHGS